MRNMKSLAGLLIVPALAVLYAAHAMWELSDGTYRRVTIIYTAIIAAPMVILGAFAVAGDLLKALRPDAADVPAPVEEEAPAPGSMRRLILFIAASLALVATLNQVGYLIGFFAYSCFVLWALDMRRPVPMLAIAVAIAAMVHFVFAGLLGQDLPLGLTAGWLGD